MRTITFRLARVFGSELAIYVPDSSSKLSEGALGLVHEGATIAEILEYPGRNQPPAASIESICKDSTKTIDGTSLEVVDCDGYYVDLFSDLSREDVA
jgi:hypothetical protein